MNKIPADSYEITITFIYYSITYEEISIAPFLVCLLTCTTDTHNMRQERIRYLLNRIKVINNWFLVCCHLFCFCFYFFVTFCDMRGLEMTFFLLSL